MVFVKQGRVDPESPQILQLTPDTSAAPTGRWPDVESRGRRGGLRRNVQLESPRGRREGDGPWPFEPDLLTSDIALGWRAAGG